MGTTGSILTSLNGHSWAALAFPEELDNINNVDSIIYTGETWIAFARAGANSTVVITSPDGVALTRVETPNVDQIVFSATGNSITVGAGTAFIISNDEGANWTSVDYSNGSYTQPPIAFGNGVFLSVQSITHNTPPLDIQSSTDGLTWTTVATMTDLEAIKTLRFANTNFYLLGSKIVETETHSILWKSADGITWSEIYIGNNGSLPNDVAYGNSTYVLIQNELTCYLSTDGINFETGGNLPDSGDTWMRLTFADGLFVAMGNQSSLAISTDGTTWALINPSDAENVTFADIIGHS